MKTTLKLIILSSSLSVLNCHGSDLEDQLRLTAKLSREDVAVGAPLEVTVALLNRGTEAITVNLIRKGPPVMVSVWDRVSNIVANNRGFVSVKINTGEAPPPVRVSLKPSEKKEWTVTLATGPSREVRPADGLTPGQYWVHAICPVNINEDGEGQPTLIKAVPIQLTIR
jgi:hypothetical protein